MTESEETKLRINACWMDRYIFQVFLDDFLTHERNWRTGKNLSVDTNENVDARFADLCRWLISQLHLSPEEFRIDGNHVTYQVTNGLKECLRTLIRDCDEQIAAYTDQPHRAALPLANETLPARHARESVVVAVSPPGPMIEIQEQKPSKKRVNFPLEHARLQASEINQRQVDAGKRPLSRPKLAEVLHNDAVARRAEDIKKGSTVEAAKKKWPLADYMPKYIERNLKGICKRGRRKTKIK